MFLVVTCLLYAYILSSWLFRNYSSLLHLFVQKETGAFINALKLEVDGYTYGISIYVSTRKVLLVLLAKCKHTCYAVHTSNTVPYCTILYRLYFALAAMQHCLHILLLEILYNVITYTKPGCIKHQLDFKPTDLGFFHNYVLIYIRCLWTNMIMGSVGGWYLYRQRVLV